MLTYSTIVVTRNRPEALALSLPLLLAQTREAREIIVVDSSDDPSANEALVVRLAASAATPLRHMTSSPGTASQRNAGLREIGGDVAFMPDDDSLVWPDALERMMAVYERDAEGRIGGVAGRETAEPPPGAFPPGEAPAYRPSGADRLRARIGRARRRTEERIARDPLRLAADRLYARLPPPPAWLGEMEADVVEWMTGFRMSFRTEAIRRVGFCESLGRYALYEDIDAGLGVIRNGGLLVTVGGARIMHYRSPGRRTNGRAMGAVEILNRGFVTRRSGAEGPEHLRATAAWARLRMTLLLAGARSRFGRDRLAGAASAYRTLPALFAAPPDRLEETYLGLREACFGGVD